MKPELWYYAHRYTCGGTATEVERRDNLRKAAQRALSLQTSWAVDHPERLIWCPWINMALAGIPEEKVWPVNEACIKVSAGVVLDLDGDEFVLHGIAREDAIADVNRVRVEVVP